MLAVHASMSSAAPMRLALNGSSCSVAPSVVTPTSATSSSSYYESLPKSLAISCPIYGDFIIPEAPLIELLLSEPIQRLKSVLQHGITGLIGLTPSPPVTRYAHSVGAMLLVRQAGGSVEAQASALLHDVAHTALSHVVDGAFGYVVHEEDKMEFLNKTEVPAILRRHFENAEDVLEEHNYPLLELDAPAVCADRLDYGIRDSYAFGFLTLEEARSIAKDLRVSSEGRFAFASQKWARCLSVAYMKSDEYAWSNPRHGVLYEYAADTIKYAYSQGLLKKQDLWIGGDELFWKTMVRSPDAEIARLASRVSAQVTVDEAAQNEVAEDEETYSQTPKVRTIDPDVLLEASTVESKTLSELDEEYHQQRQAYIKSKTGTKLYKVFHA